MSSNSVADVSENYPHTDYWFDTVPHWLVGLFSFKGKVSSPLASRPQAIHFTAFAHPKGEICPQLTVS